MIALRGVGYLCGERPFRLHSSDQSMRFELAYALGNTHSREAIPILFTCLGDKDENVRRAAAEALVTLTHRSQGPGVDSITAVAETQQAWIAWWHGHSRDAITYGPKDCASNHAGDSR